MTDSRHLVWRKTASGQALHAHGHGRALASIEPDAKYPKMWRVHLPDGWLSDMARLEWAKEGALATALAESRRRKTSSEAPPVRQNEVPATHVAGGGRMRACIEMERERAGQSALTDPESPERECVDATLIAHQTVARNGEL